jgi:enoyl-CoA hydratase/carnithine racemase
LNSEPGPQADLAALAFFMQSCNSQPANHQSEDAMTPSPVLSEKLDAVALLTLNHPERRNALSLSMLESLRQALREIPATNARVVILRALGPVFSSGHDLKELTKAGPTERERIFALCTEVMQAIRQFPVPVIAQVQGLATAAGCQLAATCDLVVASTKASFATPGVKIGLFCSTPAVALCRVVPGRKALEMLLTGEAITAAEAERWGLVNRVVDPVQLEAETLRWAQELAERAPDVIALGKRNYYEQLPLDVADAYLVAQGAMVENAGYANAKEGMRAFLEKRKPVWDGGETATRKVP